VGGGTARDGLQRLDLALGEGVELESTHAAATRDPCPEHRRPLLDRVRIARRRRGVGITWGGVESPLRDDHADPALKSNQGYRSPFRS
jgi:hypothetical protein